MQSLLRRHHSFLPSALALFTGTALLVSVSACDTLDAFSENEDDPDVELGHFGLTLDGAVTDTIEGTALFGTATYEDTSGTERDVFTLTLTPDSADVDDAHFWFIAQLMRLSERPAEGDYAFAAMAREFSSADLPTEDFAFNLTMEDTTQTVIATSDAGTLTITTSSSSRFAGSFSVEASGLAYVYDESDAPRDGDVTIEGEFNALGGEPPSQQ